MNHGKSDMNVQWGSLNKYELFQYLCNLTLLSNIDWPNLTRVSELDPIWVLELDPIRVVELPNLT